MRYDEVVRWEIDGEEAVLYDKNDEEIDRLDIGGLIKWLMVGEVG